MTLDHPSGTTLQQELYSAGISFGIVKPHSYRHRRAIENMITRSGLSIPVKKYPYLIPRNLAALHYEEHIGKPFYDELVKMMTSGPAEIMIVEGPDAINRLGDLTGATDPREAELGTIRHRFGDRNGQIMYNAFHRSDRPKEARREIYLYFDRNELPDRVVAFLDEI